MKRILSLDGGGIHGVFTLQILRRIEQEIRARPGAQPDTVLAEYFDLIAGTSTGAIIASMLAWGATVDEIDAFYQNDAKKIFALASWWRRLLYHNFTDRKLALTLQKYFSEADGQPALLGSARLRTKLLVVLRNATTGSPWVLTNHPAAEYNRRDAGRVSNLEIPLWKIVRASTAAPTFFPSQEIQVGSVKKGLRPHRFIDGGVSPYNNPAHLAYRIATQPAFRIGFPIGADRLHLVSVGVGQRRTPYFGGQEHDMIKLNHLRRVVRALLDANAVQQDTLCRISGLCLHGEKIDEEIGDLIPTPEALPGLMRERHFTYVRYNQTHAEDEVARILAAVGGKWDLANLALIKDLTRAGALYAETHVRPEHLR